MVSFVATIPADAVSCVTEGVVAFTTAISVDVDIVFGALCTLCVAFCVTTPAEVDATTGKDVELLDVTVGGRGHNVSFCTIFPDVVYIVIGPSDDVFAASDTVVVFDDTGHAVGTLISREDGVVLDAEGAVSVAFGARTDIVVVFCTTFSGVVFSSKGTTEVAFAVGSIGVVSIVVTFGETNLAVVPFSVMRVADVAFLCACACRPNVVELSTVFAANKIGVTNSVEVAFRTTSNVVVASNVSAPADVEFGAHVVALFNVIHVVVVFIVMAVVDDAFAVSIAVVVFGETNHVVVTFILTNEIDVFNAGGTVIVAFRARNDIVVAF